MSIRMYVGVIVADILHLLDGFLNADTCFVRWSGNGVAYIVLLKKL